MIRRLGIGTSKASLTALASRPRAIAPVMFDTLEEVLLERPDRHLDELAAFIQNDFEVAVSMWTFGRVLKAKGWSRKITRCSAKEQNADLRDRYTADLTAFAS
jgi:transposase